MGRQLEGRGARRRRPARPGRDAAQHGFPACCDEPFDLFLQHRKSIEVYRFADDGSVEIRSHDDVPDASDPVAGALFEEHLPDRP